MTQNSGTPSHKTFAYTNICHVVSCLVEEENGKKLISAVYFVSAGSILLLWFSLLYTQFYEKLPPHIFYACSAIVGGALFGLIWWGLDSLLFTIYARTKPQETLEQWIEPSRTPRPAGNRAHPQSTRKEKVLSLFLASFGCFSLANSILVHHLTSSQPPKACLQIAVQFFAFYALFCVVIFMVYAGKGVWSSIRHKHKRVTQVLKVFFVITTFIAALVATKFALNTSTPFAIIQGDSMLPTLREGDMTIIQGTNPENIRVGEIIAFKPPSPWESMYPPIIIHRVANMTIEGGEFFFRTQGDNNSNPEPFSVPAKNVYGSVQAYFPYIGLVYIFLKSPTGLSVILLIAVIIFAYDFLKEKLPLHRKTEQQNSKTLKHSPTTHKKDDHT